MNIVTKSLEIATAAHEGQFRRDGKTPYISHPIAVRELALAEAFNTMNDRWDTVEPKIFKAVYDAYIYLNKLLDISRVDFLELIEILSLSHDIAEDAESKGFTINYIVDELKKSAPHKTIFYFKIIEDGLKALTHREPESYLDYILRAKANPLALIIKYFDITHNLSTRTGATSKEMSRTDKIAIDKYLLARFILLN